MFICLPKKEIFTTDTLKKIYQWYIAPPYPWYIDSLIHDILTHLSMVYWPPYPWYFDPSAYLLIRNEGVNIPWMKIDHRVNLPWGSKYHMTPILSSFITYHRICNQINTSTTSGTGATYLSRAPEFTPVFSGVCVTRSLVLCVCFVDHCLSFCHFLPLCCPSFDLQILITPLVSWNSS
jgi:hypothetical protein